MKKAASFTVILTVILSIILLPSCRKKEPDIRALFIYPAEYRMLLTTASGAYEASFCAKEGGGGELTLLSPASLAGTSFLIEGGVCRAKYGDWSAPVSVGSFPEKGLLFAAFSPPDDAEFLREKRTEDGSVVYVFTLVGETGNDLYILDAAGTLLRVEHEGAFPFTARVLT